MEMVMVIVIDLRDERTFSAKHQIPATSTNSVATNTG